MSEANWNCPRCGNELGELNAWCEYCKYEDGTIIYNPKLREIRIYALCEGDKPMTPAEELYVEFFNKHINYLHPYVIDMDLLEIRAYREKLAVIAKDARAGVDAANKAEKEVLKAKGGSDKPTGFARSVNIDETSTNAINTIKERQKRMSKTEKLQEGLKKLFQDSGMSAAEAEREAALRMTNSGIKTRLEQPTAEEIKASEPAKPIVNTNFVNPFLKKNE